MEINSLAEHAPACIDPRERLGLVSSWGTKCGVAAYSKLLMQGIPLQLAVFAPYSKLLVEPDAAFVRRCWTPGELDDLVCLEECIKESGVTTVLFQVHYGFFNFVALSKLIESLREVHISTSIQLHSTADRTLYVPYQWPTS